MRRLLGLVLLLTACCSHDPLPTAAQRRYEHDKRRPQDMTGRLLSDPQIPVWLKKNYPKWVRHAYDLEKEIERR